MTGDAIGQAIAALIFGVCFAVGIPLAVDAWRRNRDGES